MTTIVRAVQTCTACPSQWDAWDDTGRYLYLRYRSGIGTAQVQPGPFETHEHEWDPFVEPVAEFGEPSIDGCITLAAFCELAGLTLATASETP